MRVATLLLCLLSMLPPCIWAQKMPIPKIFASTSVATAPNEADSLTINLDTGLPIKQKSTVLAGALSFILPGLGELYAERFDVGQYFLAADVALILGVVGLNAYGQILRADYQTYARLYANVSGNKSEEFWRDIADWQSREAFNESRLRRRQYSAVYERTDDWQWQSNAHRLRYREMRIASETAFQASYYVIAAMGINRLLSAINAVRLINETDDRELGSNILISSQAFSLLSSRAEGIKFSILARF
jgi:hypothetical protein